MATRKKAKTQPTKTKQPTKPKAAKAAKAAKAPATKRVRAARASAPPAPPAPEVRRLKDGERFHATTYVVGPTHAAYSYLAPSVNHVHIEWSADKRGWEGWVDGVPGVVLGDDPAEAARNLREAVLFGFRVMSVYGCEQAIAKEAKTAIEVLKQHIRATRDEVIDAARAVGAAAARNELS